MKCKARTKVFVRVLSTILMLGGLGAVAVGETIGVFYNSAIPQHASAAGDIQTVLEARDFSVEIKELSVPCVASTGQWVAAQQIDQSIG